MSTGLLRSPLLCTDVPGTSTSRWPWISIPVRFRFVGGWGVGSATRRRSCSDQPCGGCTAGNNTHLVWNKCSFAGSVRRHGAADLQTRHLWILIAARAGALEPGFMEAEFNKKSCFGSLSSPPKMGEAALMSAQGGFLAVFTSWDQGRPKPGRRAFGKVVGGGRDAARHSCWYRAPPLRRSGHRRSDGQRSDRCWSWSPP